MDTIDLTQPFTRSMAADAGVSRKQLRLAVDQRIVRAVVRGVYVGALERDTLALRLSALSLVVPPHGFVCDHTAAWLFAGDRVLPPNGDRIVPDVAIFVPGDMNRLRRDLAASGRRSVLDRELVEIGGVVATSPLRTAIDLARLKRHRDSKLAGMDAMLATGSFNHDELLSELDRFRGMRGIVAARTLAPLADAGAQSFGESALRLRWYDAGLPRPVTQIPVRSPGREAFIDLGLPEHRFGAEYDGEQWHRDPDQIEHDRDRREWLSQEHRWSISAMARANVFGRAQDAEQRLRSAWAAHRERRPSIVI